MSDPHEQDSQINLNQFYDDDSDDDDWLEQSEPLKAQTERFTDQELIASGGMKDIFKVFDTKTDRYIALAKLRKDVPEL